VLRGAARRPPTPGGAVLTVDYDRLGVKSGDRLLDIGCGFGRHAYEAARRGAQVVALDSGAEEVARVQGTFGAMADSGQLDQATRAGAAQGDARHLPFPDGAFDRVIASEVLEHIPDDLTAMRELARVLRPGGTMGVTVPRCGPELVNWMLSDEYHDTPGGHVRIYRRSSLEARLSSAGLRPVGGHHAHALHSPYWWLRCLVGTNNEKNPLVAAYHKVLVWDIVKRPRVTRVAERVLSPVIGKSLVVYLYKPKWAGAPARSQSPSATKTSAAYGAAA
jgi:SAM-dependent methyltransferase